MQLSRNSLFSSYLEFFPNEINERNKWDSRFLRLAREVGTWSKDPSTKVGAVIVDHSNIIRGVGYNGFCRGVADDDRLCSRDIKYKLVIHAEENAILNTSSCANHTLYTFPFPPCLHCACRISQAGIKTVVSVSGWPERWDESIQEAFAIFDEVGIEYLIYDIIEEP